MNINDNILYGNEWINYNQEYHKLYIEADGIYRIPYQTLNNAGVPLNAVDFQLYAMGEEVPVYISTNGTLGSDDYIEFYAEKNKGAMDTHLYSSPQDQFNPYHSMYTDTLAYFLTWNTTGNHSRLVETPNDLSNPPLVETHFTYESYQILGNQYSSGKPFSGLYESTFSPGEGFGGGFRRFGTYEVPTPYASLAGDDAQFWIRFASEGDGATHDITLSVNNVPLTIDSASYASYRFRQITQPLATNSLPDTTTVQLTGNTGVRDNHNVSFVKVRYPREFKFGGQNLFKFNLSGEAGVEKYLEITDFDHEGIEPVLYDLANGLRLTTALDGNLIKVVLPASDTDRELVLINPNAIADVGEIYEVNFTDFETIQGDYLMISHPKFIDDTSGIIQEYSDYRAGTGFTPIVINVEELYDQFAYGISKHAQSIRNFTGFSIENWVTPPRYMFMIGKSRPYSSVRNNPFNQPSYTPSFGDGPSDNLLTATTESDVPRIPVGRIPVHTTEEISIYLNKIMAYEAAHENPQTREDRERLKRIVHLSGGDTLLQYPIRSNMNKYKDVIEGTQVGAEVISFLAKKEEQPWQTSKTDSLRSLINNDGINLMTFKGHGTYQAIDFNIDNPNDYNNQGHYFTMLVTGCESGQIHQKARNISERFVFADTSAAVAFMGNTNLVGLSASYTFTSQFYDKMSNANYGEGIGDIIQATIESVYGNSPTLIDRIACLQMTLNGDPALKLNYATEPDYVINEETISFGSEVPTNRDINLTFTVSNLGKAVEGQFKILIDRFLPDGSTINAATEIENVPLSKKEYTIILDDIENGGGQNHQFRITIDADNDIAELPTPEAENNNTAVTEEIFILTNVVKPLNNFGIEGDPDSIILKAAIDPAFSGVSQTYYMEIDTTEFFDSPIIETVSIVQSGGLLEWTPTITYIDSTVYYWRAREEAGTVSDSPGWVTSSFIFLDGESSGWNQSHFYQFQKDELIYLNYGTSRRFEFVNTFRELTVKNAHTSILPDYEIDYSVNNSRLHDVCEGNKKGMYVALFDKNMSPFYNTPVVGNDGLYGSWACKNNQPIFFFPTDSFDEQQNFKNFLDIQLLNISGVSYVLIYSLNDYMQGEWVLSASSALNTYGLTELQTTATIGSVPYVAMIDLTALPIITAEEILGNSESDIIEAIFLIEASFHSGRIRSTPIELGNSPYWGSLHWEVSEQEIEPNLLITVDRSSINVYGLAENNEETLLIEGITESPYYFGGTEIDPVLYPRIQLEYVISDERDRTAPQLEYWRVLNNFIDEDNDLVQDSVDVCLDEPGIPGNNGCPCIISNDCPCMKLSLKVLKEGSYNSTTGEMNTTLNTARGLLPGQTPENPFAQPTPPRQPYSVPPWNYGGAEGVAFTDADYTPDAVDWVLVSLRTNIDKASEVGRAASLLLKDGTIEDVFICEADNTLPEFFYIVVEHRNHIGVMSPTAVEVIDGVLSYDFSVSDSYKDATSFGQKQLPDGKWAMIAGDGSQIGDTQGYDINGQDKALWIISNGAFDIYNNADFNLDGDCSGGDKALWDTNNGVSSRVPK